MARLIKALLLFALFFAIWRLAQPRILAYNFADVIKQDLESRQVSPSITEMHDRVMELGKGFGLDLTKDDDDVSVTPLDVGGFEVKVHYDMPVDLIVYKYNEHFDFVTDTRIAALPK